MGYDLSKEEIKEKILGKLKRNFGKTLEEATQDQIYKSCALSIRDVIVEKWTDANKQMLNQGLKRLYYLSAEFLMGRALVNNMINLHLLKDYQEVLTDLGLNLENIEEQERDAGLGNGGLGRCLLYTSKMCGNAARRRAGKQAWSTHKASRKTCGDIWGKIPHY